MFFSRHRRWALGFAAGAVASMSVPALAQDGFPNRPVKIIVPASPGGDTDLVARALSDLMSKELNQAVVVDNKTGAGGQIGIQAVVNAPADGHTIGMVWQAALTVVPYLQKKLPFNPTTDLVGIGRLATTSNALVVAKDSPLKDMSDLIALARRHPGSVSYASWGVGTGGHLAGVLINQQAHVKLLHVPYKGSVEAIQAVLAREVQVAVVGYGVATTQSKGGNLRILALLEGSRNKFFPGVPTVSELGYPIAQSPWFGLIAPAKTPPAVLARLESALLAAAKDPGMASKLAMLSITPAPLPGTQFSQMIKTDFAVMGQLVEAAGIQRD